MGILPALGLGLDIGKGLFQGVLGLSQLFRGNRMNPQRPTYEIPQEQRDMLALRQQLLNARTPGAAQAEQNIQQSQAAAVNNVKQGATDAQSVLAAAGAAQGTTNRAMNQLSVAEAQDYYNRLQGLEQAQQQMIQEKQRAFQINEYQPFIDATNTKAGLTEGGFQNIYGALGSMGGVLGKMSLLNQGVGMTQNPYTNPMSMGAGLSQSGMNIGALGASMQPYSWIANRNIRIPPQ